MRAALSQLNADTSRKQVRRRRPHNCRLRLSSLTDIVLKARLEPSVRKSSGRESRMHAFEVPISTTARVFQDVVQVKMSELWQESRSLEQFLQFFPE